MRRWLSGLRRTIGNRVTVNPVRRFKSSSPRQIPSDDKNRQRGFFYAEYRGFEGRQASVACAGRRVLPPTKQRIHAVFRVFSAFVMKTQTHRSPLAPTYVLAHFTKQNSTLCCFKNFCSTTKAHILFSAPDEYYANYNRF